MIDLKLDEAIAKQCYLDLKTKYQLFEKTKYQLLPEVVIPHQMTSNVKITKFDKTPNTTLYTTPD